MLILVKQKIVGEVYTPVKVYQKTFRYSESPKVSKIRLPSFNLVQTVVILVFSVKTQINLHHSAMGH